MRKSFFTGVAINLHLQFHFFAEETIAAHSHICNPDQDCSGAFEFGKTAFEYYIKRGGSETDYHTDLAEGLCDNCISNLKAGFFTRKEELER